jgi:hypothetical protein
MDLLLGQAKAHVLELELPQARTAGWGPARTADYPLARRPCQPLQRQQPPGPSIPQPGRTPWNLAEPTWLFSFLQLLPRRRAFGKCLWPSLPL